MDGTKKAIKAAFPLTIPVLIGYLFLGFGFGVLLTKAGYSFVLAPISAMTVYSGSLQYVEVELFKSGFSVFSAIVMTVAVNIRHLFYGLSLVEKYKGLGKYKFYCIFGLTDETFSLAVSQDSPKDVDKGKFYFFITLFDQFYWICGCTLGAVFGQLVPFNPKGIEFVMTALFVVIFVEQWESAKTREPAMIGLLCSAVPLIIFKIFIPGLTSYFLIIAMVLIFFALMFRRNSLTRRLDN